MVKFCVSLPDPLVFEMFQKLAFKAGYRWESRGREVSFLDDPDRKYLVFDPNDKTLTTSDSSPNYPLLKLEAVIERLVSRKTFKIGCQTVEISPSGIKGEDFTISPEEIETLYKTFKAMQ